ncbi:unnamed protein product [Victoria cruziana]
MVDPIEGETEGNPSVENGEEPQVTEEQEVDWKVDEEFKKFMGNPSVEAAIKLEKKRTERKLKELSNQTSSNPIGRFFSNILRDSVEKERESAIVLSVATFGTIALTSGFFLKPDIATRITAARYGVELSPSFLVPSNWTGCLGVMNNYKSLLPNKRALFDIPVARTASAYLTSLALAVSAFVTDGSFNGGDNALPQFFYNNPLLSFIQFVIGPYSDELGNVLPNAVEGLGVPVDPLAFAGLLGMVITSLNLLPCGRLEGGRIAQALFGRNVAATLSFATSLFVGIGGLSGSVLCWAWGLFDEITPIGDDRYGWGLVLALICFLTLFPNGGGTFSTSFLNQPFFRGDV